MICAIVPVKAFALAKSRLAAVLTPEERRELVMAMLGDVLTALRQVRAVDQIGIVSREPAVLTLAAEQGLAALLDRAGDLNGALSQAALHYAAIGADATLVLPADVPLITANEIELLVGRLEGASGAVLAAARDGGTNALLMRPPLALPFLFGADSLSRHIAAAQLRGLTPHLFSSPGLELDVDTLDDLLLLIEGGGTTASQRLMRGLNIAARAERDSFAR